MLKMIVRFACVGALALLGAGCATVSNLPPEQEVTQLANQRWAMLVQGDWSSAYKQLVPSYREVRDLRQYRNGFAGSVRWVRGEVVSAQCEVDKCQLRVKLTTEVPLARRPGDTLDTYFDETWLNVAGRWYYYQAP